MRNPQPKLIGSTELWSARLHFAYPHVVAELQDSVTEFVTDSGITVVGYYANNPPSLTLLRWPETREGYRSPSIPECVVASHGLATKLRAKSIEYDVIAADKLHTMMGRKRDGYNAGNTAPLSELERPGLRNFEVTEGYMISARTVEGAGVEPYGEPVGILLVGPEHEAAIHQIGDNLAQWHYAIERGTQGETDLYETPWAINS